ncbi:MAG TPA: porin, partial [Isosphaeraceae bacterium]|nr:porin [Isosphaeraceae bacterium]
RILLLYGSIGQGIPEASAQAPPTAGSVPPRPAAGLAQAVPNDTPRPAPAPATRREAGQASGQPQSPTVARRVPAQGTGGSKPKPTAEITLEERLRRMEEAYLRMEQSNRQMQAQYGALLKKYDDLSRNLSKGAAAESRSSTSRTTRPVSRETPSAAADAAVAVPTAGQPGDGGAPGAEVNQPPEGMELAPLGDQESGTVPGAAGAAGRSGRYDPLPSGGQESGTIPGAAGAAGRSGRSDVLQPGATGAQGRIRRGSPSGPYVEAEPEDTRSRMERIGAGAEGTGGRVSPGQQPAAGPPPTGARGEERRQLQAGEGPDLKPKKHRARVEFAEGLEFTSEDEEFKLQFHNLTQTEFRGFDKRDLGVLQSQFFIPRQRWYFTGDITKNFGFYTVINRGYGSLDLLDAFISVRFGDRLRFRLGRMKTPYLYEYFSIAEGDLIAPERSIWAGNMALNRQIGMLALGELLKNRFSYAVGLYNGPRRSFQDSNSAKDLIGYFNTRPFLLSERYKALQYFNIGGSIDVGYQKSPTPQPINFETANDQTTSGNALSLSPTFLTLNKNVIELGERIQWGAHIVWFYKSFFLLAEYGGARAGYGFAGANTSTPINFDGWNVTASYFVTGEQLTRRVNVVKPRNDFNFDVFKGGKFSPGAVELFARYSTMDMGRNVFTAGFADPNLWSNHVWATDIGLNWYLNFYFRIFLDWQHAEFGNPVSVAPSKFSSTTDIYWMRFQIFF